MIQLVKKMQKKKTKIQIQMPIEKLLLFNVKRPCLRIFFNLFFVIDG